MTGHHEDKLKRSADFTAHVAPPASERRPPTSERRQPAAPRGPLLPSDELVISKRKRTARAYVINENGEKELRLFNGAREVSIQDAALFEFGEQLTRESRFIASSATNWGCGYAWTQIRPVLERLLDVGILKRAEEVDAERVASSRG